MRNFFPHILILVAAAMFVLSMGLLYRSLGNVYAYVINDLGTLSSGDQAMWHIYPLMVGMMLSVWVANWAWKEIRREKTGRLEQ